MRLNSEISSRPCHLSRVILDGDLRATSVEEDEARGVDDGLQSGRQIQRKEIGWPAANVNIGH